MSDRGPVIPASANLPEITVKAVVLGIVLAIVLGAANAYLGLFAGMTVSACIPAAVMSMAILRAFGETNILENNIVQTAASAGEALAAGVIFTVPALVLLGTWTTFDYLQTTLIAGFGGLLGVLFTIPLRRALIVEQPLQFPEGVATAEVLMAGEAGGKAVRYLAWGGLLGALFKLGASGLRILAETAGVAWRTGNSVFFVGSNISPALVGVGYIVGLDIAILIAVGGALNWLVAIPIYTAVTGVGVGETALDAANMVWSTQTRYLGVGSMVVGGLWALVSLRKSLLRGIRSGIAAYQKARAAGAQIERTERDFPMHWVLPLVVVAVIPIFILYKHITGSLGVSAFMAGIMVVAGFLFSAVAAYMAGLVGSSNNPISGVTIATILVASLLLLLVMGDGNPLGPAAAVAIGAVVCCAASIGGDNLQDLKTGKIVGATPVKQQVMLAVGVIAAALVMAPILGFLQEGYGIGPRTDAHPRSLTAPQATLMAAVAKAVFFGGLPWPMVGIGAALAVVVILLDKVLEARGSKFRTPVLAMAVGIYLPFELSVPILIGGVVAWAAGRVFGSDAAGRKEGEQRGLLAAAGLITGEALLGIGLALPIVITGNPSALAIFGELGLQWPGVILLGVVAVFLYKVGVSTRGTARSDP